MSHADFKFRTGEDRQTILTPGLRLTFLRVGERWSHALAVGAGDQRLLAGIAATVEGEPARDNPARVISPAYQDVQPHFNEGEVCALLTGQSIPHHFSAVVTARRVGPSVEIAVDIADRCRAPVEVLAATYLVQLGSSDLIDAGTDCIVWGGDALGRGRLEFTTSGGVGSVALAEAGRRATRVQALARLDPTTYTQRLFYSWRWTPAAGAGEVAS
jgi:hypothetical protein